MFLEFNKVKNYIQNYSRVEIWVRDIGISSLLPKVTTFGRIFGIKRKIQGPC